MDRVPGTPHRRWHRGGELAARLQPKGQIMKRHLAPLAAAALAMGTAAGADPFVDSVVRNFQEMGYQFVEIERGQTQLKAEGVRGNEELEVIYDLSTGQIIKQERGRADADYIGRTGVKIDISNRDFVGGDRSGRDDDDDDSRSGSRDDDDDDSRSGSRDDDDDNSGSGSGRGDDDDDHGGSSGGSDDSSGRSGGSGDSSGGSDDNDDDD
jgi:hypothetical protein